jgi:hypothetical protein
MSHSHSVLRRRGTLRRPLFVLAGVLLAISNGRSAAADWKAGVASTSINPELPMWMSGYGNRPGPAPEIALDLKAKALAVEDVSGRRLVIVTTDLLGIPRVLRETVSRQVASAFGLPNHALIINASHTHCGPELRGVETSLSRVDAPRAAQVARYQAEVAARLVRLVGKALEGLAPAQLRWSVARAGFAMNRRANHSLPPGDPRHGKVPNPDGPVDHSVPVLQVNTTDNRPLALLFGYACHNTTSNETLLHGDYAGFAQQEIETRFPGATALFLSGCSGDQNPYPRHGSGRSGVMLAKLHGQTLALAVEAALAASPRLLSGPLRVGLDTVDLPYLAPPSRAELQSRLASVSRATSEYAKVLLEALDHDGRLPDSYPYPVQVVQFGADLTLVALASEVVVDFSLRLKRELSGRAVWVSAYNNDFMGYIPSRRVHQEGGYEGGGALTYGSQTLYRALHPGIWDPSVEDLIVAKVLELDRKLGRATEAR